MIKKSVISISQALQNYVNTMLSTPKTTRKKRKYRTRSTADVPTRIGFASIGSSFYANAVSESPQHGDAGAEWMKRASDSELQNCKYRTIIGTDVFGNKIRGVTAKRSGVHPERRLLSAIRFETTFLGEEADEPVVGLMRSDH